VVLDIEHHVPLRVVAAQDVFIVRFGASDDQLSLAVQPEMPAELQELNSASVQSPP
jgi:hypothetical protein